MTESAWHDRNSLQSRSDMGIMECQALPTTQLTSEAPLARRALISSSLSSGQAMGDAEATAMRLI